MHGLDLELVTRLKFVKTRKEENIKGKGLVYSWENWSRQPTNNGFVVIIQNWGQMLQHHFRIVVVRANDEQTCVPIVDDCTEADSKLAATLIAHVVENSRTSIDGNLWDRIAGWWIEQEAAKVISQLKNEAPGYGKVGTVSKTDFAAQAQKQNAILSQQELKTAVAEVPRVTKAEDLFHFKTKNGWLFKEGSKWKTWKKRWFRLSYHVLVYYNDMVEDAQAMDLKLITGFCELKDCTLRETTRKESGKVVFELYHANRSLFMYAESEEERAEWMEAFRVNCQYKERVYNRFQRGSQEGEIREANLKQELEETKKALDELRTKTEIAALHSEERMSEVKKKEKDIEELASLRAKLKEVDEDLAQQTEIVGNLKTDNERLKGEVQTLQTSNAASKGEIQTLQASNKALMLQCEELSKAKEAKEEPKITLHVAEKVSSPDELELATALEKALAQVFELKEQKKVLVKEVKRLTKT
jgi:hypothetical protein